jgi:hypothetical protein
VFICHYWPRPIWASIWKWYCSNPITGYFPGVWTYGQFTSGHIGHKRTVTYKFALFDSRCQDKAIKLCSFATTFSSEAGNNHRTIYIYIYTNNRLFSRGLNIWTVYFRSYWSYKNAFIWTKYVINKYIKTKQKYNFLY